MKEKILFGFVVVLSLLVIASIAGAQEEQWLQYHNEREADRIVGDAALGVFVT